jgi:hypothetical protein
MRPLLTLSARFCAACGALVLAAGIAAGAIRLLPWLIAPGVPLRLSVPFARALLVGVGEVALLVALPAGVAIAAAVFVERGEARALCTLGVSPRRLTLGLAGPGLAVVALYIGLSSASPAETPGRLAARLLAEGRASCAAEATPRRIDVPLATLAWLCFREGPKLVGRLPGVAREAWFSADDVWVDADLRRFATRGVSLATRLESQPLHLRVGEARFVGLRGWGRPKSLTGTLRAALIGVAALATALTTALVVIREAGPGPVSAGVLSGLAAGAMAFALSRLDARDASSAAYVLVPAAGISMSLAAFWLFRATAARFVARRNLQ